MAGSIKNITASVHHRLLSKARESSRPFNELLQHFAIERFIYRLSKNPHADRFILNGGLDVLGVERTRVASHDGYRSTGKNRQQSRCDCRRHERCLRNGGRAGRHVFQCRDGDGRKDHGGCRIRRRASGSRAALATRGSLCRSISEWRAPSPKSSMPW